MKEKVLFSTLELDKKVLPPIGVSRIDSPDGIVRGVNFTHSMLRLDRCILGHRLLPDLRRDSFCPRLLDHPRHQSEVVDVEGRGECIINDQLFVGRFVAKRMGGVWRHDDVVPNGGDHFLRA